MCIFCVYFFVIGCDIDFKVSLCLPLMFSELNATDFFLEDGLADQISEQAIASIFVFFIPVHEISEE